MVAATLPLPGLEQSFRPWGAHLTGHDEPARPSTVSGSGRRPARSSLAANPSTMSARSVQSTVPAGEASPAFSFGTAVRDTMEWRRNFVEPTNPGPGAYTLPSLLQAARPSSYVSSVREDRAKAHASVKQAEHALELRQATGPAFYSPFNYSGFGAQVDSRFPSTSGGRFPRSMRSWELDAISRAKDVTPGPGMYNPRNSSLGEQREGPMQTGPRHSFPMADRSVGQKVHLSKEHTRELLLSCSPSPVTYAVPSSGLGEQVQSVKPSRPAYTFGHSDRFFDRVIAERRSTNEGGPGGQVPRWQRRRGV